MCALCHDLSKRLLTLLGMVGLMFAAMLNAVADPNTVEALGDGAYLYRHGQYRSLFIVSDEGVIVTDPINEDVAVAYRAAIATITDRPVRFVVYSHDHWDRVSGARVFVKEGAKIIAQEQCAQRFAENPNPSVIPPDLTFSDRYTVELGNRSMQLYYFGPSHGDCLTVFVAEPANIIQIVDIVNPPGASFPPDSLVPYIRPHNLRKFFAKTGELIDRLGIKEIAAREGRQNAGNAEAVSPPLAPTSIVREQAKFWEAINMTVNRAIAEHRVGIDSSVRLHDDEYAMFESYIGYNKNELPLILRRFTGFHDMGR